jgi:hypothetical protein
MQKIITVLSCLLISAALPSRAELLEVDVTIYGMD